MAPQVPSLSHVRSAGVDLGNADPRRPKKVIVLSGSKFWARGRDRERESETADGGLAGALTAMERCDRCGAQAYVRALLPNGLELLFCAHHNRQHSSALTKIAVGIHDETDRLACPAA
jgi:hypothetical protein